MTAPLRVGLLGCGRIARLAHLPVLSRLRGVTLVAVAEADPQRRAEVRRPPAVAMAADYRELLDRPDVEAVIVALPPRMRARKRLRSARGRGGRLVEPVTCG